MKSVLQALNRTPGVLGSAYLCDGGDVCDCGEAIGGDKALELARRAAAACRKWADDSGTQLEGAVFVGANGRMVLRTTADGLLVAFAENDAAAGLLKMRMREAAQSMTN